MKLRATIDFSRWLLGLVYLKLLDFFNDDKCLIEITHPDFKNTFHGYYDVSFFNPDNNDIVIYHANDANIYEVPNHNVPTFVIVYDWKANVELYRSEPIYSWNWQQGCRAMWLSGDEFAYNSWNEVEQNFEMRIVRMTSFKEIALNHPIQAIGKYFFTSIDYTNLAHYRPDYGYFNKRDTNINAGLIFFDKDGSLIKEITLKQIAKDIRSRNNQLAECLRVNHILVSPSGRYVVFLVRYSMGGRNITDLYKSDANGYFELILPNCGLSHYCFLGEYQLVASLRYRKLFGWAQVDTCNGEISKFTKCVDGHPTLSSEECVVTDTSPSKLKIRTLYSMDSSFNKKKIFLRYAEDWKLSGQTRVDMHPTVSTNGKLIQVDLVKNAKRFIGVIDSNK